MNMPVPAEIEIKPGEHPTGQLFGMTFNLDTIWVTVVAGAILLVLGFLARRALTKHNEDHVPTKLQLVWEGLISTVTKEVETNVGRVNPLVVPLAVSLFFFILICNWLEVIPTELNEQTHLLPSPTADTNLTYAMAILVMVGVWAHGIKQQGLGGYLGHFFANGPLLAPLNIVEELLKPVTLALRLFGNIFAGGIMLALIGALVSLAPANIPVGSVLTIVFTIIWKAFDILFLGGLQAFIFALLTVLYFGMAGAHDDDHGHDDEPAEKAPSTIPEKNPQPVAA